jgi:hypothetical protein
MTAAADGWRLLSPIRCCLLEQGPKHERLGRLRTMRSGSSQTGPDIRTQVGVEIRPCPAFGHEYLASRKGSASKMGGVSQDVGRRNVGGAPLARGANYPAPEVSGWTMLGIFGVAVMAKLRAVNLPPNPP